MSPKARSLPGRSDGAGGGEEDPKRPKLNWNTAELSRAICKMTFLRTGEQGWFGIYRNADRGIWTTLNVDSEHVGIAHGSQGVSLPHLTVGSDATAPG